MCGRFAGPLKLRLHILILSFAISCASFTALTAQAQSKTVSSNTQVGRVLNDEVVVYQEADFDSPTLGRLKRGTQWTMSKKVYGAFYQVRLTKNRIGYVTDADIVPLAVYFKAKAAAEKSGVEFAEREKRKSQKETAREGARIEEKAPKRRKGFENQNYQGLSVLALRYREETMGLRPTDNMTLLGFKASGNDGGIL